MNEPLKIGVVGVGYLGSIHARIYTRLSDVALVGVNDVDSDVGRQVAADCECDFYSNVDQRLATCFDTVVTEYCEGNTSFTNKPQHKEYGSWAT